jgi:O-antigen/teichoic acid export membrane protein
VSGEQAGLLARATSRGGVARSAAANTAARLLAILGLTAATVVIARTDGAGAVGSYALLRMLPGLVGVLCVAGLPGALAYFLAPRRRGEERLWPTLMAIAAVGATIGCLLWAVGSVALATLFFPHAPLATVLAAALTVPTQLLLTVGKTALQGLGARRGGDTVIAAEEIAFLPCYLLAAVAGLHGLAGIVFGLALADLAVAVFAWWAVARRLHWRRLGLSREHGWWGRPRADLARQVIAYGMRGQLGGLITLLNLRLDFLFLGALAGPAVLGTYAVASKYAELVRLPGTALTWVTYPRMAAMTAAEAAVHVRRLLGPALALVSLAVVPLFLLAGPVLRLLYGAAFDSGVRPAQVLLVGMLLSGASGVASGYLYGRGRPGLNSLGLGLGLVATVALDLALIPPYGALGAAVASSAAYLLGDAVLVFFVLRRSAAPEQRPAPAAVDQAVSS